ncbi:FecR domain-containing protein [Rhodopseudomonas palustris]|uniref:FecR domain-containing protein n=1 Tax=Rhodopseudomonas palustris TaxID=1076 RepID=UPI0021F36275|nr:FecR domain-containing protein [Rhodopseudomonas palustris]UYO46592.1 FecR domain-containing protein [Rhodopseudomonas palustris]
MRLSGWMIGAAALLAAGSGANLAVAQEVGKASAVNPAATANLRTISIGESIAHKERIKTTDKGSVQILFIDKTSMTVGPNSDLTIDEYVYDPNSGTGKLAARLGKGALRFVGGQISHTGDAEIKTAAATVGIRGGVAMIGTGFVFAGYGSSTVTTPGGTVTLGAGEFTQTPGAGEPPSPPGPPPPNFVQNLIQSFQSAPGQSGGAGQGTASRGNVQRAEARATGTPNGSVAGSLTPQVPTPLPPINQTASTLNQTIQTSTQQTAVEKTAIQQASGTLFGFIGGLMTTWLTDTANPTHGNSSYATVGPFTGTAVVGIDAVRRRVQANFDGTVAHDANGNYLPGSFSYQFGSLDPNEDPQGGYYDQSNFAAGPAIRRNGSIVSTIDGAPITNQTGAMVTISREMAQQYGSALGFGNIQPCDCDYTKWGFWSSGSNQGPYYDWAHGFWVAGRPPSAGEVPLSGQASYVGHAVAAIQNDGSRYYAAGVFNNTVNFGARTGQVSVTGLDGTNYAGQVSLLSGTTGFVGSLAGDVGSRNMALAGSFFRGVSSPVGEMGGSLAVSGPGYLGAGIFAAKMK